MTESKIVRRYQCDYCGRLFESDETMSRLVVTRVASSGDPDAAMAQRDSDICSDCLKGMENE